MVVNSKLHVTAVKTENIESCTYFASSNSTFCHLISNNFILTVKTLSCCHLCNCDCIGIMSIYVTLHLTCLTCHSCLSSEHNLHHSEANRNIFSLSCKVFLYNGYFSRTKCNRISLLTLNQTTSTNNVRLV
jgi:hypothetical protein